MSSRVRWRIIITIAVTFGSSVFIWYPFLAGRLGLPRPGFMTARQLRLGLDLEGGVHMVLRVNTDEAVLAETRNAVDRLRETDPAAARTFTLTGDAVAALRADTVRQARQAVERRVDELGVAEPRIAIQGAAGDEIIVQLPGIVEMERARQILGATALLEWKLVEEGPAGTREALLAQTHGTMPAHTELVKDAAGPSPGSAEGFYLVRRVADITGRDLRSARPIRIDNGQPAVAFSLTRDGAIRFAQLTGENVGRRLAIILDGRVQSAPQIEGRIDGGEGYIRGRFTQQEAADLSLVLRAGALPASLTYLGGGFVGPSLGRASIHSGVLGSLAGLGLVAGFMLLYYNRAGLNAIISVVVNLLVLLGLMAYSGAALTLPGIAGLILTIGIGVDSNVLIFERIKEELAAGRTSRAAVTAGFDRVFLTILDTHVASLIAAAVLFQFGTGPIRGFATTLTFGLIANVFTAVFVSRTIFEMELSRREGPRLRLETFVRAFRPPRIDAYRWRGPALILSLAVITAGLALTIARGGLPLGVDFSGGTLVTVRFAEAVTEAQVRQAIPGEETVQRYGNPSGHEMLIGLAHAEGAPEGDGLAEHANRAVASLRTAGLPEFEVTGTETVGPAIGADLRRKGVSAMIASIAGITGYIALRFRPAFAAGAIAATVHDVLATVSLVSVFGYDLSLNVVAAILTITGYSVNDTIVTFDRVRENRRAMAGAPLTAIVNAAVNQTLGRTMITAGTTFLAVLALFIFGGDVLEGFAFTMLVGIVCGTYSTIFIAAAIPIMLATGARASGAGAGPRLSA
jgi:protein-export membrane protein SecD/preprotein translocase SecF subunit